VYSADAPPTRTDLRSAPTLQSHSANAAWRSPLDLRPSLTAKAAAAATARALFAGLSVLPRSPSRAPR